VDNKQIETRDGLTLRGREWPREPARGTIVLVHGLGEHVGRYAHIAAFFNDRGWRVVGYDHRGHGRSDGARGRLAAVDDLLIDLARAIDAVRAEHPGGPLVRMSSSRYATYKRKDQPATSLMRAINSSTALSTGTFSFTTRFIALAQAFSLLRMVNL